MRGVQLMNDYSQKVLDCTTEKTTKLDFMSCSVDAFHTMDRELLTPMKVNLNSVVYINI